VKEFSLESLIQLFSIPGIGPYRLRKLVDAFGSPRAVLTAPLQKLTCIEGIDKITATRIKTEVNNRFVARQLNLIAKYKVKIITYWDDEYPELLKRIHDPPAFLYVKGEFLPEDNLAMGIVGTRIPSQYGRLITEQFSRELVGYKFTVVSGLARGIDTVAHKTVLNNQGRTIAVLGSGLDQIYPPENRKLAQDISYNGAVISEYPLGTLPDAGNFPKRNRIISGLSYGVLIIEAGVKSGALITAFHALEQNREVFAVPGPINSGKSSGTNKLIKEGAKLVQGIQDILQELQCQIGMKEESKNLSLREKPKTAPELEKKEKEIFNLLSDSPVHVDQLANESKKSVPEVLSILLTLELLGIVKQLSGKMFIRII
jgi:DNA processing protein